MTQRRCRSSAPAGVCSAARGVRRSGFVDVIVVEFAVHIAYLDPRTGTGYLVTPRAESDVAALDDPLVGAAWSESLLGGACAKELSLHAADRRYAFERLALDGWVPLHDENGEIEEAGWTTDGRLALCLYGDPPLGEPCMEELNRSLTALDLVAGLHDPAYHRTDG
ncbi:hypothetical protein E1218_34520 [Kribbella turkmenica]|uniref:Uncharacterized protein n=1 Tax=Kribbella turkmenica TaxID=2530375 RepID=A0A4R4W8U2_9ACTN|nr:hypothetical protein [Kribbella turkmenica]TDD13447.1 hypothetical protein E1218_34520 [Kribbella turkmenica]